VLSLLALAALPLGLGFLMLAGALEDRAEAWSARRT
jgi:hypothetical protein